MCTPHSVSNHAIDAWRSRSLQNLVTVCVYKSFLLKTATKQPISFLSLICSLNRNEIVLKDCKAFFKGTAKSRCFMGLVLPETGCFKSIHSSRWTSLHWE